MGPARNEPKPQKPTNRQPPAANSSAAANPPIHPIILQGIILSYAICSWCSSIDVANAAVPVVGVFALFFSGVLKRTADIGWWWRWMVYATPTYWAVAAQIRNVFAGERDVVFVEGLTVTEYYVRPWSASRSRKHPRNQPTNQPTNHSLMTDHPPK
jgi:hypothetical protein